MASSNNSFHRINFGRPKPIPEWSKVNVELWYSTGFILSLNENNLNDADPDTDQFGDMSLFAQNK